MGHEEANDPERMRSASGGNGVDLTIEMLANVNLGHDLAVMNRNGRIVVVGSRGPVEIDPRLTMGSELTILGMSLNNATQAEVAEMHAALGRSMASGSLRPIVGTEYPIADAAEAHRAVMGGHSAGNIVLTLPQT
jgi:NADPH2:quinone reductase